MSKKILLLFHFPQLTPSFPCFPAACHSGAQRSDAAGPVALLLAPRLPQQQPHQGPLSGLLPDLRLPLFIFSVSSFLPILTQEGNAPLSEVRLGVQPSCAVSSSPGVRRLVIDFTVGRTTMFNLLLLHLK